MMASVLLRLVVALPLVATALVAPLRATQPALLRTTRPALQRRAATPGESPLSEPEEEIDEASWNDLQMRVARLELETRYSKSVTRRKRVYLPYEEAAAWARVTVPSGENSIGAVPVVMPCSFIHVTASS